MKLELAVKLAVFLVETKTTQKKIAADIEVSDNTVSRWARGFPIRKSHAWKLVNYAPNYFTMKNCGF